MDAGIGPDDLAGRSVQSQQTLGLAKSPVESPKTRLKVPLQGSGKPGKAQARYTHAKGTQPIAAAVLT